MHSFVCSRACVPACVYNYNSRHHDYIFAHRSQRGRTKWRARWIALKVFRVSFLRFLPRLSMSPNTNARLFSTVSSLFLFFFHNITKRKINENDNFLNTKCLTLNNNAKKITPTRLSSCLSSAGLLLSNVDAFQMKNLMFINNLLRLSSIIRLLTPFWGLSIS